jgi:2-C-methyl-D-erythritol 2,4-cyclodiphosphate synthase
VIRVGIGYDSHRFAVGRPLILGGVTIPHDKGLTGHSDADAVGHAVTDALLGAVSLGDIGGHFPDTDPANKDADSMRILREVVRRVNEHGWSIQNVDVTVVMELPRLAPHVAAMCSAVALALGVDRQQVSIKAKTNEGMGFIGRGEGVAVIAVASLLSMNA